MGGPLAGFRIALHREPAEKERVFVGQFLGRYRGELGQGPEAEIVRASWRALARGLLASNEFLFVE